MKAMTFEKIVEKIAKREKEFGKKKSNPNKETLYLAQKGYKSEEEFAKDENRSIGRGRGQRGQYRGRWVEDLIKERNNVIDVEKLVILPVMVELLGIKLLTRKSKYKITEMIKVTLLNLHIMLLHIVI